MGWKYNIQYNTSCYGNHVFLHNTNKCAFEKKKIPLYFRGPNQQFITHQKMSSGAWWNFKIGTRPYTCNNGVLL